MRNTNSFLWYRQHFRFSLIKCFTQFYDIAHLQKKQQSLQHQLQHKMLLPHHEIMLQTFCGASHVFKMDSINSNHGNSFKIIKMSIKCPCFAFTEPKVNKSYSTLTETNCHLWDLKVFFFFCLLERKQSFTEQLKNQYIINNLISEAHKMMYISGRVFSFCWHTQRAKSTYC